MLEFVIAFPLVILCVFAVLQLSLLSIAQLVVQYAAYSAARAGLVYQGDSVLWGHTADAKALDASDMAFEGLDVYGQTAHNEAQLAGCEAAAQVCTLLTGMSHVKGDAGNEALTIPGWGPFLTSSASRFKTRAWLSNHYPDDGEFTWPMLSGEVPEKALQLDQWSAWESDRNEWNVYAVVEHDFELIVPMIGELLAWGERSLLIGSSGSTLEGLSDKSEMQQRGYVTPHISLVETCVLPKPYKTVVPVGIFGNVPEGIDWGADLGFVMSQGDNYGSTSVLLMRDTTGIAGNNFIWGTQWDHHLDFGDANPLAADTMTISIDVAGIHSYGDSLSIAGVELFNFNAVAGQWVQDIEHMHHFEITIGKDQIEQIFSNPADQWNLSIWHGWDDIGWRNIHIGFDEKDEHGLQVTPGN